MLAINLFNDYYQLPDLFKAVQFNEHNQGIV
jgi:hypothetical protein